MSDEIQSGFLVSTYRGPLGAEERKKRYFILRAGKGILARLDVYPDGKPTSDTSSKQSMYIEDMKEIQVKQDGEPNTFQFVTAANKKQHVYTANSEAEMKAWVKNLTQLRYGIAKRNSKEDKTREEEEEDIENSLYESAEESNSKYKVTIADTDSAQRCKLSGEYTLIIGSTNITFTHPTTGATHVWPYKYIRRYGRSKNSFSFEAGRKCDSGEGMFTAITPKGNEVFFKVQEKTKLMKSKDSNTFSRNSFEPDSAEDMKMRSSSYANVNQGHGGHGGTVEKMPVDRSKSHDMYLENTRSNSMGSQDLNKKRPKPPVPGKKPPPIKTKPSMVKGAEGNKSGSPDYFEYDESRATSLPEMLSRGLAGAQDLDGGDYCEVRKDAKVDTRNLPQEDDTYDLVGQEESKGTPRDSKGLKMSEMLSAMKSKPDEEEDLYDHIDLSTQRTLATPQKPKDKKKGKKEYSSLSRVDDNFQLEEPYEDAIQYG